MIDMKYISDFLNTDGVEGPRQTRGYIPCRPGNFYGKPGQDPARFTAIGVSGVTIATGVDLGQTDAEEMDAYGLPRDLIETLSPYFCLSGRRAINRLAQRPLTISADDAEVLDLAVHKGQLDK